MKHQIHKARLIVLLSILMLSWNTGSPEGQQVVQAVQSPKENPAYEKYLAEREAARWESLVKKIAEEAGIKDSELAETVVQAIEDAACEFDMNPWLLASLIRVESYGNPSAVSSVGAIGLTQIMPATGRDIAAELGIPYSRKMLYDPAINVRMGTYYLRTLLDTFGNIHAALAAYNWGLGHILERIENDEDLPVQYPGKILRRLTEHPKWDVSAQS